MYRKHCSCMAGNTSKLLVRVKLAKFLPQRTFNYVILCVDIIGFNDFLYNSIQVDICVFCTCIRINSNVRECINGIMIH